MCVFVHCKCLYALCLKKVFLLGAVCFLKKKKSFFWNILLF